MILMTRPYNFWPFFLFAFFLISLIGKLVFLGNDMQGRNGGHGARFYVRVSSFFFSLPFLSVLVLAMEFPQLLPFNDAQGS